jgi:hypothetical protein
MRLFIEINGWAWRAAPDVDDAERAVLAVAADEWGHEQTSAWLRDHLERQHRLNSNKRHATRNRVVFVSNTPMNTGRSSGAAEVIGHRVPDRVPDGHTTASALERKTPTPSGFSQWRDPDSNRGHHDFQLCDPRI